ncbi:TetR/AcrR family transcriptional regulator [Amycolatopsis rhizosphaerae]|uniref:TetR/AcrR family transcriptional regulator n=1 Tax=Amycolatopsis rhizosphaerae TaxID=2053003 RepID=A0A558BJ32_9PSEU|nr:TetR family transcriptional regulator [Amycolatopsis rhizosphaerae]TVT36529.1 TetR/AcrR family transcriptional regulator [Amycolatopsis rhizosphaerae]
MTEETPARRSDATRAAIKEAARRRFAAEGYRKATIRAIAADAGIDPAMVMRYYGSKEELFSAAVEVDLGLPDLNAVAPGTLGEVLTRQFLTLWERPPTSEILLTLLRSAVTDEALVAKIQQVFVEQVSPAVLRFGDPADAPRRAGLVVSQFLGLALCRYVLRLPPVVALTEDRIVADVAPVIQRYLTGEA